MEISWCFILHIRCANRDLRDYFCSVQTNLTENPDPEANTNTGSTFKASNEQRR